MIRGAYTLTAKRRFTPDDSIVYIVPTEVIHQTDRVLKEYACLNPPNEGFVYWGGTSKGGTNTVSTLIIPVTKSSRGRVSISNRANFDVVRVLNKNNLIEVAQVHSHPSNWVDHSMGDDRLTPFKVEGLISIVVPKYCINGMLPLTVCGVHRYTTNRFIRLSEQYIQKHFKIVNDIPSKFVDLRI